ncbi:unnamed protein product, partial [marine sediment metagenome]
MNSPEDIIDNDPATNGYTNIQNQYAEIIFILPAHITQYRFYGDIRM